MPTVRRVDALPPRTVRNPALTVFPIQPIPMNPVRSVFGILVVSAVSVASALQMAAQVRAIDLDVTPGASGASAAGAYQVSGFEVRSRWSGAVPVPLKKGDLWTPGKQSEVFDAIREAFDSEQSQSYLLDNAGEVGVLYVDVIEEKDEVAHTVNLVFRPLRVHVSLAKIGDNVLPIPRSAAATRYEGVPPALLALQPVLGVTYDRAFGTAIAGGIHNDLLTLPDTLGGRLPVRARPDHLDATFNGSKSFESYYRANAGITYAYRRVGMTLQEMSFGGLYDGTKEPLAGRKHVENSGGAQAGATFRIAAHTRMTFGSGYDHASETLEDDSNRVRTTTEVQRNRLIAESLLPRPIGGFLRAAVWEDNGWSDQAAGFHQRLVGRIGYAREMAIAPNQTIGLELIAGGGRLWGDAPDSRRFFGGNSPGQFLYDNVADDSLLKLPAGPMIRSFGQGEAVGNAPGAARGGDGFWHVNANLTFPIPVWSFPLIPSEEEVRNRLKNGINVSGRNILISTLKNQGMSREDAIAEADRTLDEIRPATEFIIDEANLYSVKPLLMFDAGGLSGGGGSPTWLAAGGGLQLTVVTAKFELGYMHTLSGPTNGDRGNFFVRLVFRNLF